MLLYLAIPPIRIYKVRVVRIAAIHFCRAEGITAITATLSHAEQTAFHVEHARPVNDNVACNRTRPVAVGTDERVRRGGADRGAMMRDRNASGTATGDMQVGRSAGSALGPGEEKGFAESMLVCRCGKQLVRTRDDVAGRMLIRQHTPGGGKNSPKACLI
jgi:hypothetical protein